MRVAVNLNMFHPELPLLQRYKIAAAAGFRQVEVSLPYSEKAEDLKSTADSLGLTHTLINAPTGDWSRGFRGLAALSSCKTEFRESVDTAIHYAKTLKCDNGEIWQGRQSMCLIESRSITTPAAIFFLYEQAKDVIDAVKLPNLKIQYDVFHAQQICGQISATIKKYKELIGYISDASMPSADDQIHREIDTSSADRQLRSSADHQLTIGI
ncbi:AP endonuclease, family 2 [Ostertagia ostertagi]